MIFMISAILHDIIEIVLFFGCQMYNWPCTLIFRIVFALHDFAYLTVAYDGRFLITLTIGLLILVTYSNFPSSCYEPSVMMINDQMVPMQTVTTQGQNQHFYVVQNPNQVNSQTLTQPTQVASQPVSVTVPQSRPAWWLPPPHKKMFPTFSGAISVTPWTHQMM